MTIKGILARFAALYTGLVAALAGMRYFLDIDGGIAVDVVILGLSIYAVCWAFGRENGRYFEGTEKAKIVVGFIAISVAVQGGPLAGDQPELRADQWCSGVVFPGTGWRRAFSPDLSLRGTGKEAPAQAGGHYCLNPGPQRPDPHTVGTGRCSGSSRMHSGWGSRSDPHAMEGRPWAMESTAVR